MRTELDLFRRFFDEAFLGSTFTSDRHWSPASRFEETDSHYLLSVDMPGVPKAEIKIEFQNDLLSVSGERKPHGKFQRTFRLPTDLDADKIEAVYEDGVLRVALPKSEAAKPKQIPLGDAKTSSVFSKWFGEKMPEKEAHAA